MSISLTDGKNIDVINVASFKTKNRTFYNHEYEHYDEFYNDFIKNINKIVYIYVEYECDHDFISDLFYEKHYLKDGIHHRLDGPAITQHNITYYLDEDEIDEDSSESFYIDGVLIEQNDYFHNARVIKYQRRRKLKKLKIK